MRLCEKPGCNNRHHAKGWCKTHYTPLVVEYVAKHGCSVDGCPNRSAHQSGKRRLCTMHLTRLCRHGSYKANGAPRGRNANRETVDPGIGARFRKRKGRVNHSKLPNIPETNKHNPTLDLYHEYPATMYWARDLKALLGDRCYVCGWTETTNDAHHIHPLGKGGANALINGIVLCPNHHRMAHNGSMDVAKLMLDVKLSLLTAVALASAG